MSGYGIIKINFQDNVKKYMRKLLLILSCAFFLLFLGSSSYALTPNITGYLQTVNNDIVVNIAVANATELEATIKSGIEKEIVFTMELIRVWKFWPDEFVVSKKIRKTIKYDNLRDQFWTSSFDGINRTNKKFKNYGQVRNWIFSVSEINIANIRELEPARYYIRVIVESRSIDRLPVMGLLTLLVPEVDMTIARESEPFPIGETK
jgi:hypothetical protein